MVFLPILIPDLLAVGLPVSSLTLIPFVSLPHSLPRHYPFAKGTDLVDCSAPASGSATTGCSIASGGSDCNSGHLHGKMLLAVVLICC